MHTTDKTSANQNSNDPANKPRQDDFRAGRTAYRGKYPDRIKTVSGGYREGAWHCTVETNGGAMFEFVKRHGLVNSPLPNQEIDAWILHLEPINEMAEKVSHRLIFGTE